MTCKVFLAVGAIVGALVAAGAARAAEPSGTVTALVGTALAGLEGIERPLTTGDLVRVGELIRTETGSRLTLQLGPATVVNLGPATRLRIEPHLAEAGGVLDLIDGGMVFDHVGGAGAKARTSKVRSPYGLIAVRGTRFFAGRSRGVFGVFLAEGRVDVTARGRTVRLRPGLGTDIAAPGRRPSRPQAWPAGRVREALQETTGRAVMPPRQR